MAALAGTGSELAPEQRRLEGTLASMQQLGSSFEGSVAPAIIPGEGLGLVAQGPCEVGTVLFRAPPEGLLTSVPPVDKGVTLPDMLTRLPPEDTFGKLVVSVLFHSIKSQREDPDKPTSPFAPFLGAIPLDYFSNMPSLWADDLALLEGSALLDRLKDDAKELKSAFEEHIVPAFVAGPEAVFTASQCTFQRYVHARMVVSTRGLNQSQRGHFLCPGLDLANHRCADQANARVDFTSDPPACLLVATKLIGAGEQIFICYDEDADFLDMFQRYGFLDLTTNVHSVEIRIPFSSIPFRGDEGWRRSLVESHVPGTITWIPAQGLTCPLRFALRAAQLTQSEWDEKGSDAVEHPVQSEREVLQALQQLIVEHMKGYPTCLEDDYDKAGTAGAANERVLTQVLIYEKTILAQVIQSIDQELVSL